MGATAKVFGCLLCFSAVLAFIVNFGIWSNVLLAYLPSWFFNPGSLLVPRIVGDVWLISGSLGWILNYAFALVYSAVLFVIGAFAILKS